MKSLKYHRITKEYTKDGYSVIYVMDCNGNKLKMTECSRTTRRCETRQEGECDKCTNLYELSNRGGRCGDCGNCENCCSHEVTAEVK